MGTVTLLTARARLSALDATRPFGVRAALGAGLDRRALSTLVAAGDLRRPLTGVYVPAALPDDVSTRSAAVCLILPDGAAVCRGTAAWLYGFDTRPPGRHRGPPPLECVVPAGREPASRPGVCCYAAPLTCNDVVDVGGIACTDPVRTALDVARWSPRFVGLAVLDQMARETFVDPAAVVEEAQRFRGHRGIARARELILLVDPRAESAGESWARLRLVDAGLPPPDVQIGLGPPHWFRLDLGYVRQRLGVEYDGQDFHTGPRNERHDLWRRGVIGDQLGWRVIVVGKGDVLGRSNLFERTVAEAIGVTEVRSRTW